MPALSQAAEQPSANVGRRITTAPAAAILAIAALAVAQPLDADLWVHLNNGRFIASRGELPYPDPFTFSAGDAVWTVHEWLPALVIFQLVDRGGVIAAVLGMAAVYALIWGLLERVLLPPRASARGCEPPVCLQPPCRYFHLQVSVRWRSDYWPPPWPPSVALHHRRTGSRWVWLLPLVFVIWGNVHASFPIGFALLGALLVRSSFGHDPGCPSSVHAPAHALDPSPPSRPCPSSHRPSIRQGLTCVGSALLPMGRRLSSLQQRLATARCLQRNLVVLRGFSRADGFAP